jgi:transposase
MPILEHGADTLQRVEIITGTGRRRRWSTNAKAAIVAETFCAGCKRVRGGAATRRQSKHVVSLASPGHAGAGRGVRGQRHATWLCASRDHRLWGPSEEQAAIEIELGAVRNRVRGTVDRRALCEVLAAVATVGR